MERSVHSKPYSLQQYLYRASEARRQLRIKLGDLSSPDTWLVLGTGWADEVQIEPLCDPIDLNTLSPLFREVPPHPTHPRLIQTGMINVDGTPRYVGILRGRIHMNEVMPGTEAFFAPRLQIDMLIQADAKRIILTAACGALHEDVEPRTVMIANKFLAMGGGEMLPLFGGEFINPEQALDPEVLHVLYDSGYKPGTHMFWRGPHFETAEDKREMARRGASVVGMSLKPELAAIAASNRLRGLHKKCVHFPQCHAVCLVHITNDHLEIPDDTMHRERAQEDAPKLAKALADTLRLYA